MGGYHSGYFFSFFSATLSILLELFLFFLLKLYKLYDLIHNMSVKKARELLNSYHRDKITYNDPHVSIALQRRGISKAEVEQYLMDPINLTHAFKEREDAEGQKWELFFSSKKRIIQIPVIFKPQVLYVLTVIKRLERWERRLKQWKKARRI